MSFAAFEVKSQRGIWRPKYLVSGSPNLQLATVPKHQEDGLYKSRDSFAFSVSVAFLSPRRHTRSPCDVCRFWCWPFWRPCWWPRSSRWAGGCCGRPGGSSAQSLTPTTSTRSSPPCATWSWRWSELGQSTTTSFPTQRNWSTFTERDVIMDWSIFWERWRLENNLDGIARLWQNEGSIRMVMVGEEGWW